MDEPIREMTAKEKAEKEALALFGECRMTGRAHAFEWVWNDEGMWTPFRRCMNCGDVQECGK